MFQISKKRDPFLLENFRFLTKIKRRYVEDFIKLLDDNCQQFVLLRYGKGKTVSQVAEDMGYTERAVYAYRDRILMQWSIYAEQDRFDRHRRRVLKVIRNNGVIKRRRLVWNLNLKKTGLTIVELDHIISQLIADGKIISYPSIPGKRGGRYGEVYEIS